MSILQSVDDIVQIFEESSCRYTVIGGIAILLHGGRASTIDFDLYVLADEFAKLTQHLAARGARVLLKADHQLRIELAGIHVDILEADQILSETIFTRSERRKIVNAICNIATPEDLIILKTLSDRPIDRRDIAELREIFEGKLDENYVDSTLKKYRL